MSSRQIILALVGLVVVLFVGECYAQMSAEEMGKMQMPDLSNDTCAVYSNCVDCLKVKGCNYCLKPTGTSFCTQIDNAKDALCIVPGCSSDTFLQSLADCSGGCKAEYDCYDCARTPGCGWCQIKGEGYHGCMEAVDYVNPNANCLQSNNVWEMGEKNCYVICENRRSRKQCLQSDQPCLWNGTVESCSVSPTGKTLEIIAPTVPAVPSVPPKKIPPISNNNKDNVHALSDESRQGNSALLFVIVVGVAVGVLMYKKIRQ